MSIIKVDYGEITGGGATKVKAGDIQTSGAWSGGGGYDGLNPTSGYISRTAEFDVSSVNSVTLRYMMTAADSISDRGVLGYSLDGVDTILPNSTSVQIKTIDLTGVKLLSFYGTIPTSPSAYGNFLQCCMKFS